MKPSRRGPTAKLLMLVAVRVQAKNSIYKVQSFGSGSTTDNLVVLDDVLSSVPLSAAAADALVGFKQPLSAKTLTTSKPENGDPCERDHSSGRRKDLDDLEYQPNRLGFWRHRLLWRHRPLVRVRDSQRLGVTRHARTNVATERPERQPQLSYTGQPAVGSAAPVRAPAETLATGGKIAISSASGPPSPLRSYRRLLALGSAGDPEPAFVTDAMKPSRGLAIRLLALALALLGCSLALAAARVKSGSVVKVDASKQLSPNQKFSRLWQVVKGDDALSYLTLDLPGRVFVTQSSDISSGYDAEVTVSGSTEDAVKSVDMEINFLDELALSLAKSPPVGEFLLIEVRVRAKNSLLGITTNGTSNDDLVILDNVLYSAPLNSANPKTRRLQLDDDELDSSGSSDLAITIPALTLKPSKNETTSRGTVKATSTGLSVIEDVRAPRSTAGAPAVRAWLIMQPGVEAPRNVNLELAVPGTALVDNLRSMALDYPKPVAGYVMIQGDSLDSLDEVEVVSTHGSSAETIQVQFRTKTGASATTSGNFSTFAAFTSLVEVNATATSKSVQVQQDTIKQEKFNDKSVLKILSIENSGQGNIFVSAPESLLVLESVLLENKGNGLVQVDVGRTWVTSSTSLDTMSTTGTISYFGEVIYSDVIPLPGAAGKVCLNSTRQALIPVMEYVPEVQARISYTGQPAGKGATPCEKKALPERVPTKILTADGQESIPQSVGCKTIGVSTVTAVVLLLTAFISF